jgi:hypothetical protein
MSNDFIQIKQLTGELKIYHKRKDFATTVSTQELVLQRPHVTYYIKLEDIISIVPYQPRRSGRIPFVSANGSGHEVAYMASEPNQYRFYVRKATLHNRSGIVPMKQAEFIIPMLDDLLQIMADHSGMNQFGT